MEQNNSGIVEQNNEYKEFVEKIYTKQADSCIYNQQSLAECGLYIQDDNAILQTVQCSSQIQPVNFSTSLVSNQENQEYAATTQILNVQQTQCETTQTDMTDIKIEPVESPESISPQWIMSAPLKYQANYLSVGSISSPYHSQVITAAAPKISEIQENEMINTPKSNVTVCTENLKPIELTKSSPSKFRAVEFVLNNLDSVPGEEKFYGWSDKAKDFANTQLSKESHESVYAQKINSNVKNSNNSQSTSVVMAEQTDLSHVGPSKRKSDKSSSKRKNKVLKNTNWAAEKDRTLKTYSNNLMRKKPKSWQPQEHC
ncbi:hypothetical protein RhiirB3_496894 [Rhizophagus irregularis]|nr:hypothetical protein RhiirB3_496894 [Rhizophagus irregularis]